MVFPSRRGRGGGRGAVEGGCDRVDPRGLTFFLQTLVNLFTLGQKFPYKLPHTRAIPKKISKQLTKMLY